MYSFSPRFLELLEAAFLQVEAAEGTIWLLNETEDALLPVWNTGPNAEKLVGGHRQPLTAGLISLVCITGQAVCENEIYRNAGQDPTVDRKLNLLTCSMIAIPFVVEGRICGVVSCVKLKTADFVLSDPPPFTYEDLAAVSLAVEQLEQDAETVS